MLSDDALNYVSGLNDSTAEAVRTAFELAWSEIVRGKARLSRQVDRPSLAGAIIAVAPYHGNDIRALKNAALERLAFRRSGEMPRP